MNIKYTLRNLLYLILSITITSCATSQSSDSTKTSGDQQVEVKKSDTSKTSAKKSDKKSLKNKQEERRVLKSVTCKRPGDSRKIAIERWNTKGCHVRYDKFKKSDIVAKAAKNHEYCVEIKDRIKGNLEKAGFSCGDEASGEAPKEHSSSKSKKKSKK